MAIFNFDKGDLDRRDALARDKAKLETTLSREQWLTLYGQRWIHYLECPDVAMVAKSAGTEQFVFNTN
jgi:hypothetical protein